MAEPELKAIQNKKETKTLIFVPKNSGRLDRKSGIKPMDLTDRCIPLASISNRLVAKSDTFTEAHKALADLYLEFSRILTRYSFAENGTGSNSKVELITNTYPYQLASNNKNAPFQVKIMFEAKKFAEINVYSGTQGSPFGQIDVYIGKEYMPAYEGWQVHNALANVIVALADKKNVSIKYDAPDEKEYHGEARHSLYLERLKK